MATSKKDAFSEADIRLAAGAKALAHPARVAILKVLAERDTCICGEIVDVLPLAQATVSQHLKALRAAGLVVGTIEGPRSCYCLNRAALRQLSGAFKTLFGSLEDDGSCC